MFKAPRFWIFYLAAWIPYAVSYFLAFASVPSLHSIAFTQTLYNIGPAALLGVGVLHWSQLFPWSRHIRPWFYPLQVASAITYSLLWCVTALLTGSLAHAIATHRFVFGHFSSYALQWEFFSGLMIYCNIAGFANVAQISRTLAEAERRRIVAESLKTKAELAVLRAQLNPHFLFNTLNSLAALVGQEPDHAGEALMQLGDMLRYTLKEHRSNSDDDVSLRDELIFTDNYLALEMLRLGDRLTVRRSIDPTTLSCRLPALTIQPLVENAIRHGIAPRFKGGSVAISTKSERGMLLLSVSDDGVGVEPEQALSSAGLGIRTIQQRLFLYSHGTSSFSVEGKRGEGFTVSIALPLEAPEEEENASVRRSAELSTR